MSLFDEGDHYFKCGIHGAALILLAEMGIYNFIIWRKRRTKWHLLSATVYTAGTAFEFTQVYRHHRDSCEEEKSYGFNAERSPANAHARRLPSDR